MTTPITSQHELEDAQVIGEETLSFSPLALTVAVLLSTLIVGIFTGNMLVIVSVVCFSKMRTLSNAMIASLASADLLVAVVVLPISLQRELSDSWTLGQSVCDLWITSDVFCCTASILNIVVIAVDRSVNQIGRASCRERV